MSRSTELGHPKQVDLTQGPVRYRERGQGRPVVFIHGLLVNGDLWRKVVPTVAEAGYRCITPDLPLGAHDVAMWRDADLTISGVARLIAEFLEALDLEDVVLVANDTGGALAQIVVTEHPERVGALVLTPCDCFENFLPPLFRPLQKLARFPSVLGAVVRPLVIPSLRRLPMALGWLSKRPTEPEISDGWVGPFIRNKDVRDDCAKVLRDISPAYTRRAAEKFGSFERPVLLVWASEDRFFPVAHAHKLAGLFPDARVELVDDSYTFVSEDRPEELSRLLTEFLDGAAHSESVASTSSS
jgi:pimeloyl-ACP methyl ester carboxylesterase